MGNHQAQKESIKIGTLGGAQFGHLLFGRHTRHRVVGVVLFGLGWVWCRFIALVQPVLHQAHFIFLGYFDPSGDVQNGLVVGSVCGQLRHQQGLVVMTYHALHKLDVGGGVGRGGYRHCGLRIERASRFARRPRLHDRHRRKRAAGNPESG